MENSIKGGKNGLVADVEKFGVENRFLTESISLTTDFWETEQGESYNLNTGIINLTGNATTSACMYVLNNSDNDLIIQNVIYILGNSTGGSGDIQATIIRNPTIGTIIDTATAGSIISNRNYGSNKTADVTFYKGVEGATLTDGDDSVDTLFTGVGRYPLNIGDLVLPKGSSLGVEITTQASNSSMNVMIALPCFFATVTI